MADLRPARPSNVTHPDKLAPGQVPAVSVQTFPGGGPIHEQREEEEEEENTKVRAIPHFRYLPVSLFPRFLIQSSSSLSRRCDPHFDRFSVSPLLRLIGARALLRSRTCARSGVDFPFLITRDFQMENFSEFWLMEFGVLELGILIKKCNFLVRGCFESSRILHNFENSVKIAELFAENCQ